MQTTKPARNKGLTAFPLKVIAIVAMLLNHIGCGPFGFEKTNLPFYTFCFVVGKLTFPIMAYLLVEGYHYTRNFKKYAGRLAVFWLLSVVPFWMVFSSAPFSVAQLTNNIMFTLLVGLVLLKITDSVQNAALRGLLVLAASLITVLSDWTLVGVLMVYGFHRVKGSKLKRVAVPTLLYGMLPLILLMLLAAYGYSDMAPELVPFALLEAAGFLGMVLPVPLLLAYNGQRGYSPAWVKWGFYAFYPTHLLVLGLIRFYT